MAPEKSLTKKQKTILEAILFLMRKGEIPTVREVGGLVGLRSPATVLKHLRVLEKNGHISLSGKSRGIRLADPELLERILHADGSELQPRTEATTTSASEPLHSESSHLHSESSHLHSKATTDTGASDDESPNRGARHKTAQSLRAPIERPQWTEERNESRNTPSDSACWSDCRRSPLRELLRGLLRKRRRLGRRRVRRELRRLPPHRLRRGQCCREYGQPRDRPEGLLRQRRRPRSTGRRRQHGRCWDFERRLRHHSTAKHR